MQAHPNVKGIFGTNEGSAIGVVNAVKELNKKSVVVVGFDSENYKLMRLRAE